MAARGEILDKGQAAAEESAGAGASVPAKRLVGRRVVVLLGAAEPALALLSRALHALGVDMLEADGEEDSGGDWRRVWISDLNQELLAAAGRPFDHPAHALPLPPGWWRKPAVQAIRRRLAARLEEALQDQDESWGFADLATARLLPVWQDVFEQLGLEPVYVWSLSHPGRAGEPGAGRAAATAAEVRWFAYGTDIYRYAGDRLACVLDEADWRSDPQDLMQRLVDRLHLRWRGTRLDLYETVSAVLGEALDETPATPPPPATLPLSMRFYETALQLEEEPEARQRLLQMVESAELLRPLITPFLPVIQGGDQAEMILSAEEIATLRQEIVVLRETCAELRRRPEPAPDAVAGAAPAATADEDPRLGVLQAELEARVAETRWLHDQYGARLRDAQAEAEALKARFTSEGDGAELAEAKAELARLQAEMVTLTNANERYLARIYELKKQLEDHGAFETIGR